ncbi:hypothetical protein NFI96_014712, partial [Prochilodus magdalenae]
LGGVSPVIHMPSLTLMGGLKLRKYLLSVCEYKVQVTDYSRFQARSRNLKQARIMEDVLLFHFPVSASLLTLLSTLLFLLDVALDLWAIVSLYEEGEYVYMGVLIALLLGSSIVLHVFSWIWYADPEISHETNTDKFASKYGLIGPLHILQLGVFLRLASVLEISLHKLVQRCDHFLDGVAAFLKHDLSMLRLFETFTESIPQLVLMITLTLQERELHMFTASKIAGSLISITITVLFYHRDMRDFVPEDQKMGWSSSVVFFLWNLFLITTRVFAIALFASVLPCYIGVHFLCWWFLLFICACNQKTDFMENKGGEWLYRATVGLIWYFSWFNVASGRTKVKSIIYHACMMVDLGLLLGLWFWKRSVESARLGPPPINPYIVIGGLPALYAIGLLLRLLYYWKFHPNHPRLRFEPRDETPRMNLCRIAATANTLVETDSPSPVQQQLATGANKRMRNMAAHFYS